MGVLGGAGMETWGDLGGDKVRVRGLRSVFLQTDN